MGLALWLCAACCALGCSVGQRDAHRSEARPSPAQPTQPPVLDAVRRTTPGNTPPVSVIALHGLGDTPEHFFALFEHWGIRADIALLRAPHPWSIGSSWFAHAVPLRESHRSAFAADVADAAARVCTYMERRRSQAPFLVTGFSQGGVVTYGVAATCPHLVRCALVVAGTYPGTVPKPPDRAPWIAAFHGTADTIVPFAWGRDSAAAFARRGWTVDWHPIAGVGHVVSAEVAGAWLRAARTCAVGHRPALIAPTARP